MAYTSSWRYYEVSCRLVLSLLYRKILIFDLCRKELGPPRLAQMRGGGILAHRNLGVRDGRETFRYHEFHCARRVLFSVRCQTQLHNDMKIRALSRSSSSVQAPGSSSTKAPRNLDPAQHAFARAREYTRALNAVKLERSFAQPFLGQLGNGHVDGVYTLAQDPSSLQRLASGSGDGVVKVWDLTSREEVFQAKAHDNIVRGICWSQEKRLLTCGTDKSIKVYEPYKDTSPVAEYLGKGAFTGITHHRSQPVFATSGSEISLWDLSRPSEKATSTLSWPTSVDTITTCAFNQTETSILASAGTDRSIVLYDIRTNSPLHRTVLSLATNAISWNPMEAFNFATANEDHNVYIFDSRNLSRALNVLKGHVAAVMDVSFSPTGEELVTASYDRTVRLWNRSQGQSRDIYHSKRMQRVFSSVWTQDNNYIISGSDDGNVSLSESSCNLIEHLLTLSLRSAFGAPKPHPAPVCATTASNKNSTTPNPSNSGTPTCPKSNGYHATGTFPRS